jgi:hypothetical protein
VLIARLTAEDRWPADETALDFLVGVAVGLVEAARETAYYLQMRAFCGSLDNGVALRTLVSTDPLVKLPVLREINLQYQYL